MTFISVLTYEDLPDAALNSGSVAAVANTTGVGEDAKYRGYYFSDGDSWVPGGTPTDLIRRMIVELAEEVAEKSDIGHTHLVEDIADFETEVNAIVGEAIATVLDSAPAALDTLNELAAALGDDANFASTMTTALVGKVDKVAGKALSENDLTNALKSKLDAIASGATENSSDATLLARANHTGTQAISTVTNLQSSLDGKASSVHTHAVSDVTNLQTALDGKAASGHSHAIANVTGLQSALDAKAASSHTHAISDVTNLQTNLNSLDSRITALETFKTNVKLTRFEVFTATTNGSGDVTINTSTAFTNPKVAATPAGTAGAEGYHCVVTGKSGTSISVRVFKNKTQGVLIGGTIDPDEAAASINVDILVAQAA